MEARPTRGSEPSRFGHATERTHRARGSLGAGVVVCRERFAHPSFLGPRMDLDHTRTLRLRELELVLDRFPPGGRVLEIGGGAGWQAAQLASHGFDVVSVDVEGSRYEGVREFPVVLYDGHHLPFPDASFDIVWSSNVLEHVDDLDLLLRDTARVLRETGMAIHAVPTPAWRAVTTLATAISPLRRRLVGERPRVPVSVDAKADGREDSKARRFLGRLLEPHGAHGNSLTELATYRREIFERAFTGAGFELVECVEAGQLYSGLTLFGPAIPTRMRETLARVFGSSVRIFVLRKRPPGS